MAVVRHAVHHGMKHVAAVQARATRDADTLAPQRGDEADFPMRSRDLRLRWLLSAILAFSVSPVIAAGIDCHKVADDPVATALCKHPKLLELDAQLSVAYAQALARNPSRAAEVREDEINWLGDRNRTMWSILEPDPDWGFPARPSELDRSVAHMYELRMAFLRNLGDPNATRDDPTAQKLLTLANTSLERAGDTAQALESAGLLVLPKAHQTDRAGVAKMIARLAAPPTATLRASLKNLGSDAVVVEYLPAAGIGGAYAIEGTALCQDWVLFEKRGNTTVRRKESQVEASVGCMQDGGSTEYPALLDHQPVMLAITYANDVAYQMDLEWQRWLSGDRWGPLLRLRFRHGYTVSQSPLNYCEGAPARCAETASTALDVTRRYLRNPWTLPQVATLTATAQAQFQRMMKDAPKRKYFGAIAPAWFPVHLKTGLAVGGIDYMHMGSHIYTGTFDVGFWGRSGGAGPWWVVDQYPVLNPGHLLAAAMIPPGETH